MYDVYRAAFDKISGDLSQKVDALTHGLRNLPDAVAVSHGSTPALPSGSSPPPKISISTLLANAKRLPPLDQANFQNLAHWTPTTYRKRRKGDSKTEDTTEDTLLALDVEPSGSDTKPNSKKEAVLSCFLEDKDGNPISETEKKDMFAIMGAFWQYLWDQKRAPKTFRRLNIETKLEWQMLMESNFECLRYCANHWKLDQLWINNYTSWRNNAERRERLESKVNEGVVADTIVIDLEGDSEDSGSEDEDNEDEDNEDEDAVIEVVNKNKNNKRALPDNGEKNKSKRARVEEPKEPAPPRPVPIKVTTKRARVRTLFFSMICVANNVQPNPLYKNPDYMRVRPTLLTLL